MNELEALREQFRGDRFATEQAGITISEAHEGYALCEMPLTPLHRNARGTPMGGAIFTLADFASAVAANFGLTDTTVISLHSDITFLSAAKGEKLLAEATRVRHGRTVTLYEVTVTDELGTLVARVGMNGYAVKR